MSGRRILLLSVIFLSYTSSLKRFVKQNNQFYRSSSTYNNDCLKTSNIDLKMALDSEDRDFDRGGRFLLSGIALTGAAETAFLTYSKISSTPLGNLCSNSGSCSSVLDGPYSTIPFLNVPLSAVAFIGYTVIALLSIAPLIDDRTDTPNSRLVLLFIASTMAGFSLYLMTLLAAVIHTSCNFCYLSATLSFLMAAITWNQKVVPNKTKAFVVSAISVSITFVISAFLFYTTSTIVSNSALAENIPESTAIIASAPATSASLPISSVIDMKPQQEAPQITKTSSPRAMLIGDRLAALNAKMYGAFWCSHCNNQKQELGIEASKLFTYIECAKDGLNSQYQMCKDEKIPGFPTWQINGELYPGEKSLSELETLLSAVEKKSTE